MVHHMVNEIFARVNGRRVVNEIYAPNFVYPLLTCTYLVYFNQHIYEQF